MELAVGIVEEEAKQYGIQRAPLPTLPNLDLDHASDTCLAASFQAQLPDYDTMTVWLQPCCHEVLCAVGMPRGDSAARYHRHF